MRRGLLVLALFVLAGCQPELTDRPWLVDTARVLAVKSEPAEASPGELATFTALIANGSTSAQPRWRFCIAPKATTENNSVSSACLTSDSALRAAGRGLEIQATLPSDACASFGADTPPGGFRPRDPDVTGGYYQPLRVDLLDAEPVFHLQRIACGLAGASFDVASAFGQSYVANRNPLLTPLSARVDGEPVAVDRIPRGARVELELGWSEVETYVLYDRDRQQLVTQRESMRVAWYVSGGTLEREATGRSADDPLLFSANEWHAPTDAGTSQLWVVVRDSRGGLDFASYPLLVTP